MFSGNSRLPFMLKLHLSHFPKDQESLYINWDWVYLFQYCSYIWCGRYFVVVPNGPVLWVFNWWWFFLDFFCICLFKFRVILVLCLLLVFLILKYTMSLILLSFNYVFWYIVMSLFLWLSVCVSWVLTKLFLF